MRAAPAVASGAYSDKTEPPCVRGSAAVSWALIARKEFAKVALNRDALVQLKERLMQDRPRSLCLATAPRRWRAENANGARWNIQ